MLEQARAKGLADRLENIGLQELSFEDEFDGSMTIDAMENVSPEDWPPSSPTSIARSKPGGHIYLTVEEVPDADIDAGFADGQSKGCRWCVARSSKATPPAITTTRVAPASPTGYAAEGLEIVEEASDWEDGWGYWHLLLHAPR